MALSLQEEARRRAEALRLQNNFPPYSDDSDSDDEEGSDALFAAANAMGTPSSVGTGTFFNNPQQQQQQQQQPVAWNYHHPGMTVNSFVRSDGQTIKHSTTGSTSAASSSSPTVSTPSSVQLNYSPDGSSHQPPFSQAAVYSTTPRHNNMAQEARRDWQNHGTGITQALEDVRHYNHQRELPTVRVFASSAKVDAAGQDYTAYLVRVEHPNDSPSTSKEASVIEHRFSDFYKLQQQLEGIQIPVAFPSRMTWAGRLANWTPSQILAPDQHQSLIQYRLKQLDAWLVHVVQLTPQLPPELRESVYQFLDSKIILPCQQPLRIIPKSNSTMTAAAESLSWNNPVTFSMGSALRQACRSVETLCHLPDHDRLRQPQLGTLPEADQAIPLDLLRMARGILFVTVVKAGWVVSGRIGTGLLIQRLNASGPDSSERAEWSAPTAVGTFGVGWGALVGADVAHYMVIFTADSAVRDLVQQSTTLQVGAELSAAVGPLGRSTNSHLQSGDWTVHTAYAYAHTQGFFLGVSLEGSLWQVRHDVNAKFYGQRNIEATHLLHQLGPPAAQPLYDRLDLALSQQQTLSTSSWLPSPPPRPPAATSV